jgi:hypothetical protein
MPEEFLDGADIIAGLEQMGCKGVAQGVAGDALLEAGFWAAWRTARCRAEGSMGWRSFLSLRGSMARREAGKRYCQPGSREGSRSPE